MKSDTPSYHGYRYPPEIISHAVWLYHRFCVSFRDVEDLLAQRGITVSYEAIRLWCIKFGPEYARGLKRRQGRLGDTWHPTSRRGNVSGKCEGSNLQVKRSDSYPCMDSSKISSASDANCCKLAITESYEVARSSRGTPSRAPRDSNGDVTPAALACSRNVNLTVPVHGMIW